MTKEEIMRRVERKIDEDKKFSRNIGRALETGNDYWLMELIGDVIGIVIDFASDIWDWLQDIFS